MLSFAPNVFLENQAVNRGFAVLQEYVRYVKARVRPRFFDQVGHETMYASSGNKHFFTK